MPPCVPGGLQPRLPVSLPGFSWMSPLCPADKYVDMAHSLLCKNTSFSSSWLFQQCCGLILPISEKQPRKIPVRGVAPRHHLHFAISQILNPRLAQFGSSWVPWDVWTLLESVRKGLQTGSSKRFLRFSYWNTHSLEGKCLCFTKVS